MATVEQALAATLRNMRLDRGISLKQAGEEVGTTPATISRWEHGIRTPTPTNLVLLASAYASTPSDIYRLFMTEEIEDAAKIDNTIKKEKYEHRNKNKKKS